MAEPKKKTSAKKTSAGTKKTSAKKTSPKKTTATPKKAAPVKTTAPVTKKTLSQKKSSSVKKTTPSHFKKDLIPETLTAPKVTRMDTSIFTTVVALIVVALVVLGGYIYSRQSRMMEPPAPPVSPDITEPQRISVSSAVTLTPDIVSALEHLVTQIAIGPDEVLQNVRAISDEQPDPAFATDGQLGDMVFEFKSASILYRPSTKQIIKTAPTTPAA